MEEFKTILFGINKSLGMWFAYGIIIALGWLFMNLYNISKRDVDSNRSPKSFSISFWFKDNWMRSIVNLIGAWAYIRFTPQFEPLPASVLAAFAVGMGFEAFLQYLREKAFKADKNNLKF